MVRIDLAADECLASIDYRFPIPAADQSQMMQDQMSGAAMAMPQDPKAAFKAEWEALEITENNFILQNSASDLIKATTTTTTLPTESS